MDIVCRPMAQLAKDSSTPSIDLTFVTDSSSMVVSAVKLGESHLTCLTTHNFNVRRNLESFFRIVAATTILS